MTAWWPRSPASPIQSKADRDEINEGLYLLSQPCDGTWLMARVLSLLTPYFTANVPESVRVMEAEDWHAALSDQPQWAIEKAVRWWKSDANPDRRKKPLEGDILAKVKEFTGVLTYGKFMIDRFDAGHRAPVIAPPAYRAPVDPAERQRISEEILGKGGYKPKRFGADSLGDA